MTDQYIRNIEQITGISASKPMDQLSPRESQRVVDAIQRIEGWTEGVVVPVPSKKPRPRRQSSLDQSVEDLDEAAVSVIMGSYAYTNPNHPDHGEVHRRVRAWFEHQYGEVPVQYDATGRMAPPLTRNPRPGGDVGRCIVRVREHFREGGRIHVDR